MELKSHSIRSFVSIENLHSHENKSGGGGEKNVAVRPDFVVFFFVFFLRGADLATWLIIFFCLFFFDRLEMTISGELTIKHFRLNDIRKARVCFCCLIIIF